MSSVLSSLRKSIRAMALKGVVLGLLIGLGVGGAQAANYDEAVDGEISNDRLAPTPITLGPGSNFVQGTLASRPCRARPTSIISR